MKTRKPAEAPESHADALARIGNQLIEENEKLTNDVAKLKEDVAALRTTLEMATGDKDFEVRKRNTMAATRFQGFLFTDTTEAGNHEDAS